MLLLVVAQLLYLWIPQLLNIAVLSAQKIIRLMIKLYTLGFVVEVNGVNYAVKHGHLDEFVCLFRPGIVTVSSMFSATIAWQHKFQWYTRI